MNSDTGGGLSYLRQSRARDRKAGITVKTWPIVAFVTIAAATAIWQWVLKPDMSPVVSYGAASNTFFKPAQVVEGEAVELCFGSVTWHRLCPSQLITHLTPSKGARIDLPPYQISMPAQTGSVPPKCRQWIAPQIADRSNQMIFSGYAESLCGKKNDPTRIVADLPAVPITINKKAPVAGN